MVRNPAWSDEEIILATELYIRAEGRVLGPNHPDVIALSELLNKLPIHDPSIRGEAFHAPKSVGLKLANIRGAAPTREGGLPHGSKQNGLF